MSKSESVKPRRKSYEQMCYLANALDYVGERWIILIIRELLGGKARFNELRRALPGVPSNLLADRLKQLESDGLVAKESVDGTDFYALTEQGATVRTALEELGRWGLSLERVKPAKHPRSARAIAMALHSIVIRAGSKLPDTRKVAGLSIDGELIEIVLDIKNPSVQAVEATSPDVTADITTEEISKPLYGEKLSKSSFTNVSGDDSLLKTLISVTSF